MTSTVSILTYSAVDHSRACVTAVLAHSPADTQLILTANGNPAAAVMFKEFQARFPERIRVVENPINEGFQIPNKAALEMTSTDLFIMLNDDAIVPAGWIDHLVKPFEMDPKAALAGPTGTCCSLNEKFVGYAGHRFEYLEGSCLACRTETVKKHGLFSPELKFAYGEDSDLSLRMRELGYTLHRVPFNLVSHARAATSKLIPNIRQIQEENHRYLRARWGNYLKTRAFNQPLILRRIGAHGDVLLLTPIIKALKEKFPLSPIYVQTSVPEVLTGNPHIVRSSQKTFGLVAAARMINFDGSYEAKPDRHFIDTYAQVAGIPTPPKRLEVFPSAADHEWAASKMPGDSWVVIHPGPSTWRGKEWPKDRFHVVADTLRNQGHKVALVGSHDVGISNDFDARGKTTIMQMASLIKRGRLFIGLDSLPMHISQAVGTPTIGLFGVTDPQFIKTDGSWFRGVCGTGAQFGMRHRLTRKTHVDDLGVTMKTITIEQVLDAVQEGLAHVAPNA